MTIVLFVSIVSNKIKASHMRLVRIKSVLLLFLEEITFCMEKIPYYVQCVIDTFKMFKLCADVQLFDYTTTHVILLLVY